MRVTALAVASALLLPGCALMHHHKSDKAEAHPQPLHLAVLVVNEAPTETLVIRDGEGRRFATVFPGRSECVVLPTGVFSTHLIAMPVGGGRGWMSPSFDAGHSENWEWRVGVTRSAAGAIDLMPTDDDCETTQHASAPASAPASQPDTTKPPVA
jgi:hypothetical protein